jgi:hypothetical protein
MLLEVGAQKVIEHRMKLREQLSNEKKVQKELEKEMEIENISENLNGLLMMKEDGAQVEPFSIYEQD